MYLDVFHPRLSPVTPPFTPRPTLIPCVCVNVIPSDRTLVNVVSSRGLQCIAAVRGCIAANELLWLRPQSQKLIDRDARARDAATSKVGAARHRDAGNNDNNQTRCVRSPGSPYRPRLNVRTEGRHRQCRARHTGSLAVVAIFSYWRFQSILRLPPIIPPRSFAFTVQA